MPPLTGNTVIETTLLARLGVAPRSKFTDGTMPHYFWTSPGGADAVGRGSFNNPYLTLRRAARESVDGRGDIILVDPGPFAETLDIGSGSPASGPNGSYAKRDLQIIGTSGTHTGRTQITGDGTSTQSTIRVQAGYIRGFVLMNVELDNTNAANTGRAYPCLELTTNDTAAVMTAASGDYHAKIQNVHVVSDNVVSAGFIFAGATKVEVRDCSTSGCVAGIVFAGSLSNLPDNIRIWNHLFQDNTTADVFTTSAQSTLYPASYAQGPCNLTNIQFFNPKFMDRGGTPVTNYANISGTTVNCGFYNFVSARDVADATLMQLPVDWIAIGDSAAAAEFIIGA